MVQRFVLVSPDKELSVANAALNLLYVFKTCWLQDMDMLAKNKTTSTTTKRIEKNKVDRILCCQLANTQQSTD